MHAGTITWNGLDLSGLGIPKLSLSQQADPPAPAQPTRQLTTIRVTVHLEARDAGTIQARLEHLQASMRVADGILTSAMGSGHGMSWHAVPTGNNLADVLGGVTNQVELGFSAVTNHADEDYHACTSASFTPAGSSEAILLHAVRGTGETMSTERHSGRASARRATTHTLTFTARVAQANPADPYATRLAWLQARADEVKALDAREGTLVMGSFNRIVRVSDLSPRIDEGAGILELQVQCFHVVLPDAAKAEANFEIRTRQDAGSGENVITISGTIEAETRAIALAKLSQIRTNQLTTGRRSTMYETQDRILDGADTEGISGADWSGALGFSLEIREARSGTHYQLKITSRKDIRSGMRWTYSGTVTSTSEATALATARGLIPSGTSALPVQVSSEESIERVTDASTTDVRFVKLDFSYEFEGPASGFIGGEIGTDKALPEFGEHRQTISGFLIAASRALAETKMTQLLPPNTDPIEKTVKWTDTYLEEGGEKRVFQKLEFSVQIRIDRGTASVKYQDTTSTDITSMTSERTVSGSIWADSASAATSALNTLRTSIFGTDNPMKESTTQHKEVFGNTHSGWSQLDFQMSRTSKVSGNPGFDIIEATLSIQRTGSIQATPIMTIPFGRPIAQPNTGYLPGKVVINATCKARLRATAVAWVQATRGLATGTKYETEAPNETLTPEFTPFSGDEVTVYQFSGSYTFSYVNGLDGVWQGGFVVI